MAWITRRQTTGRNTGTPWIRVCAAPRPHHPGGLKIFCLRAPKGIAAGDIWRKRIARTASRPASAAACYLYSRIQSRALARCNAEANAGIGSPHVTRGHHRRRDKLRVCCRLRQLKTGLLVTREAR